MFFQLSSWALALIIFALLLGATGVGLAVGHLMRAHAKHLSEPFSVLQGALLGAHRAGPRLRPVARGRAATRTAARRW